MKSFKEYAALKEDLNPQNQQPFPEIFDAVAKEMNQAIQTAMQQAISRTTMIVQHNIVGHEMSQEDVKDFILHTNWNNFKTAIEQTPGGYFRK